jgi:eukaryotic-like serine/threonine-protein kinase
MRTDGRDKELQDYIAKEINQMSTFHFKHMCQVYGGSIQNNTALMVIEYIEGENLHDFLVDYAPLPWSLQFSFCLQAAQTVNYLHSTKPPFLHRSIKSSKFIVQDKSKLVLTDFGLVETHQYAPLADDHFFELPRWTAPESWEGEAKWSEKTDIYSLGMVFFEVVSGKLPFQEDKYCHTLYPKVKNGTRPFIPDHCPPVI